MQEGVIKFNCTWIKEPSLNTVLIHELNAWRNKLYASGLIGVNRDGISVWKYQPAIQAKHFELPS